MKIRIKERIRRWFFGRIQSLLTEMLEMNPRIVGSSIRMLQQDIDCIKGKHRWSNWSAKLCGNIEEVEKDYENRYSYRDCCHCGVEMPESRIYHGKKIKEKNARTFAERFTFS